MMERRISRRLLLGAAAACGVLPVLPAWAGPEDHGPVRPPIDIPDIPVTLQDGRDGNLRSLLRGRVTAIQLMFVTCTTTCPIGAATFAEVQDLLPDQLQRDIQLLSLDVGPFGSQPAALDAWLKRFQARPGWIAAVPNAASLPLVRTLFGEGRSDADPHSDSIQITGRQAQLVWRTYELPSAEDVAAVLQRTLG